MFTGHAALALFAKRARPSLPLWLLVMAAYASDGVELFLNLARVPDHRTVIFLSHSIVADVVMAAVLGLLWLAVRRDGKGALLLGLTLVSHWPADFLTGQMKPTWPGGPDLGLFLYRYDALDFAMEAGLLVVVYLAVRKLPPERAPWRRYAMALPILLLPVQAVYNVMGYYGHWDWKTVMLRGSRATARRVRDRVTMFVPGPAPAAARPARSAAGVERGAGAS